MAIQFCTGIEIFFKGFTVKEYKYDCCICGKKSVNNCIMLNNIVYILFSLKSFIYSFPTNIKNKI